jgi:hypothetical protein
MAKIGRNERCQCGSSKKYKRCHGSPIDRTAHLATEVAKVRARADAERVQRERQQGLGKPIISVDFNGRRLVAVKNRFLHSKRWRTFQDFLLDYIKIAIGPEWGNSEIAKPFEERHPILAWYQRICEYQRTFVKESCKVHSAPMTGVVAAYLHLAYDLYALDHNAELQSKLLARLRHRDQFAGARYEVYVAATFIRAGFDVEFEDEADGNITHCEFTAIYRRTGRRFSVEAKRRGGRGFRIGRLFNSALSKHANHQRIIFIDANTRDDAPGEQPPAYVEKALALLRFSEGQQLNGQPRPSAYVFVTNTPWDLYLDDPTPRSTALAKGFQIPDFIGGVLVSLRRVIDGREAHIEMHELMKSFKDHSDIPSTFDGQIPEFAFNTDARRILIGEHYLVPDRDGVELPAEVTAATVVEARRVAYCGVTFENGQSAICTMPLSDVELAAWRRHPDTFFGTVGQRSAHAHSELELYDFFHESFRRETKERLLEVMVSAPDFEELAKLAQPELASIHAERTTNAALAMGPK